MHPKHNKFLEDILGVFNANSCELVHVTESLGRVIASDVRAKDTSPNRNIAAINGYALMCSDTDNAPVKLKVIGESTAGTPLREELHSGQAVKVYAGAILPIGADTVIPLQDVKERAKTISIEGHVMKGQNLCYAGIDFLKDEPVLKAGSVISPRDIGLLAAMKTPWIFVRRRPKIAILAVGDELAMLGELNEDTKTISSSSLMLSAFVASCGAIPVNLGVASDSEISINRLLDCAEGVDLIITTGGVSASADGLLKRSLDKNTYCHETSVKLSHTVTVLLGSKNKIPLLALSGNPISALVCATLFARPVINRMTDMKRKLFKKNHAVLDRDLDVNDKQMEYIFARLTEGEDKHLRVQPASSYDRMLMSSFAASDCVITVDPEHAVKGESVCMTRFMCTGFGG